MALRFQIDKLDDVEAPLRTHYVWENGKFYLATTGEHPKVAEFRANNINLTQERDALTAKFEGIDPESVKADRLKLAELEKAKPYERVTALEAELATERAARTAVQKQADTFIIESKISDAFLKAGGRPEARKFIVGQAASMFTVENGALKGTQFSPARPGESMTLDEWLLLQTKENAFCFLASRGGGAAPKPGGGTSNTKELRDPTPQQLGEYAADIKSGKIRVVHS